jgi:hypothetical protein
LVCRTKHSICRRRPPQPERGRWSARTSRAHRQQEQPGECNEVTVLDGVARPSCTGFQYRGNCSHAQQVAAQVAAGRSRESTQAISMGNNRAFTPEWTAAAASVLSVCRSLASPALNRALLRQRRARWLSTPTTADHLGWREHFAGGSTRRIRRRHRRPKA